MELQAPRLWVPGHGLVPPHIRSAQKAIEDYDANLSLARNENNGDWVIMYKDHPVFGLGTELPNRDKINEILNKGDVGRHGGKIMQMVDRRQEEEKRKRHQAANEGTGAAAEAMEWGYRKAHGDRAPGKVFIPADIPQSKEG